MAVEPDTQSWASDTSRKVWVLNSYKEPYKETWRGKEYTIPPNDKKEVLMGFLAARRFLGQSIAPPDQLPDGTYKYPPKSLRTVELTVQEREDVLGITNPERDANVLESKASLVCTICGEQSVSEKGLKIHTTKMHPHWSPVADDA